MEDVEVIPLRLITKRARLYVNLCGEAKTVMIWAAAHKAEGVIVAGPENALGHKVSEDDDTTFIKTSVEANESVVAAPGKDGVMAVRLVQV